MVEIYNMSAGFLQIYMAYNNKDNIDFKEVFKRLSLEMGGDGTKITKDELDDYIDKADAGLIEVDKKKLDALKQIQKNWDTISNGDDEITYDEMSKYMPLLAATLNGNFEVIEIEEKSKSSMNDAIYDYLTDYLNLSDKSQVTESDLTSYLNELISNSSDNDSNSDLIGAVTNLIASYSLKTTIETEA